MRGLDGELEMLVFVFLDHFWMGFTVRHRTCNSVLYSLVPKVLAPRLVRYCNDKQGYNTSGIEICHGTSQDARAFGMGLYRTVLYNRRPS